MFCGSNKFDFSFLKNLYLVLRRMILITPIIVASIYTIDSQIGSAWFMVVYLALETMTTSIGRSILISLRHLNNFLVLSLFAALTLYLRQVIASNTMNLNSQQEYNTTINELHDTVQSKVFVCVMLYLSTCGIALLGYPYKNIAYAYNGLLLLTPGINTGVSYYLEFFISSVIGCLYGLVLSFLFPCPLTTSSQLGRDLARRSIELIKMRLKTLISNEWMHESRASNEDSQTQLNNNFMSSLSTFDSDFNRTGYSFPDARFMLSLSTNYVADARGVFQQFKKILIESYFDERIDEFNPNPSELIISGSRLVQRNLDLAHFALSKLVRYESAHKITSMVLKGMTEPSKLIDKAVEKLFDEVKKRRLEDSLFFSNKPFNNKVSNNLEWCCDCSSPSFFMAIHCKPCKTEDKNNVSAIKTSVADDEVYFRHFLSNEYKGTLMKFLETYFDVSQMVQNGLDFDDNDNNLAVDRHTFAYLYIYIFCIAMAARNCASVLAPLHHTKSSRALSEILKIIFPPLEYKSANWKKKIILASKPAIAMVLSSFWVFIPYLADGLGNSKFGNQGSWVAFAVGSVWSDHAGVLTHNSEQRVFATVLSVLLVYLYAMYIPDYPTSAIIWLIICLFMADTVGTWKGREIMGVVGIVTILIATYDSILNVLSAGITNLNSTDARDIWLKTSTNRIWATLIGSVLASLVSFLFCPQRSRTRVFEDIDKFATEAANAIPKLMKVKEISNPIDSVFIAIHDHSKLPNHLDARHLPIFVSAQTEFTESDKIIDSLGVLLEKVIETASLAENEPRLWLRPFEHNFVNNITNTCRRILTGLHMIGLARTTLDKRESIPFLLSLHKETFELVCEEIETCLKCIAVACRNNYYTRIRIEDVNLAEFRKLSDTTNKILGFLQVDSNPKASEGQKIEYWDEYNVSPLFTFIVGIGEISEACLDFATTLLTIPAEEININDIAVAHPIKEVKQPQLSDDDVAVIDQGEGLHSTQRREDKSLKII